MSNIKQLIADHRVGARANYGSWLSFGEESSHAESVGKVKYACPVCEKLYDTRKEAQACADQPFNEAGVEVGDIFIIPNSNRYEAPAEGFEHWCAFHIGPSPKASSHFDHNDQWYPYYVVTAIHRDDRDPHRCIVTVITLFDGCLNGGWNPADSDGHHSMFRPGKPREEQKSDIGSTWWESKRHGASMGSRFMEAEPSDELRKDAEELANIRISSNSLL